MIEKLRDKGILPKLAIKLEEIQLVVTLQNITLLKLNTNITNKNTNAVVFNNIYCILVKYAFTCVNVSNKIK